MSVLGRRLRVAAAAVAAAATVTAVSACTLGEPASFSGRADQTCRRAVLSVGRLDNATTGTRALVFASERYAIIERVVTEISTDVGFPDGARGRTLRSGWIDPARASLRAGLADLKTLAAAIDRAGTGVIPEALNSALTAGTSGVDTQLLRAEGMPWCASLFRASHTTN
jgi:hypothetical protein